MSLLEKHHTAGHDDGLSYNVVFRLLNAADYGVPQSRHRVIIVGFRSDSNISWSFRMLPTHRNLCYIPSGLPVIIGRNTT